MLDWILIFDEGLMKSQSFITIKVKIVYAIIIISFCLIILNIIRRKLVRWINKLFLLDKSTARSFLSLIFFIVHPFFWWRKSLLSWSSLHRLLNLIHSSVVIVLMRSKSIASTRHIFFIVSLWWRISSGSKILL